ncbi:unnamed protein product [Cyberlindnera jadinii]|uniref:Ras-domain-containing protein n=2 Tax=Cyberlindnera jadinii (strain ATCC 18201 / CBS 1600 / BCRC 20928 / JCM 3617 / NBRC 0987 / NRRL Y-1542) TaxID=983966 RepID=A0A0H5CAF6_CYBJN|nr:unnamed protein product [Cyberlindnera jadinii]
MSTKQPPIRICVVGAQGSGKSSLTLQFTQDHFPVDFDPSVEDVYRREIYLDGRVVPLEILDTANNDVYSDLMYKQLLEADGVVVVYSVGSHETFQSVTNFYRNVLRARESNMPPTILVGAQADTSTARVISTHEGEQLASELGIAEFIECSAMHNTNIAEIFIKLSEQVIEHREVNEEHGVVELKSDPRKRTKTFTTGATLDLRKSAEPSLFNCKSESSVREIPRKNSVEYPKRGYVSKDPVKFDDEDSSKCCVIM